MRASVRLWASGAIVGPPLLIFGLLRPDDGSVSFFVLLGVAAIGYLLALHQVAHGLRPSGRALLACAALALAWRIPMVLAPPEAAADVRRYVWDAHLVRSGLSPYAVVPADPAFVHLRTGESWPLKNPDVPSPYPPGAQLFFLAATTPGESARALKLALLLCDALLALVIWRTSSAPDRTRPGCSPTSGAHSSPSRSRVTDTSTWSVRSSSPSPCSRSREAGSWPARSPSRCRWE